MSYIVIAIVALLASLLTFFSGFGLGTILTPFFAFFFPLEIAVALTGIVHFFNNIFKFAITSPHINKAVLLRFGLPAFFAAFLGAYLLTTMGESSAIYRWGANGRFQITWLKIAMSLLMIFFALFEILPSLRTLAFDKKYLSIGGILSGFLGGFSGHQGALRSAFLLRYGLSKEALVATGVAIACIIDITRLSIYYERFLKSNLQAQFPLLATATIAAFIGAYFGNKLLKKMTIDSIQQFVATMLIVIAVLLGMGVI
jgi:uncharacterized protein